MHEYNCIFLSAASSCVITHAFLLLDKQNQFLQDFIQNPADTNRGDKHTNVAGASYFLLLMSLLPKKCQLLPKKKRLKVTDLFIHAGSCSTCTHTYRTAINNCSTA
ncbi:hypothetical protein XENORESO_013539 [Xenotaenia resolanae]|uniref:Uncharacterized protein n=1 Tax=Xenotaenia resolanae TaxID=208358 RepID=A0ABV0VY74_9TELE